MGNSTRRSSELWISSKHRIFSVLGEEIPRDFRKFPPRKLQSIRDKWNKVCVAIENLHREQYRAYLQSDDWAEKRNLVLDRDNHKCRVCGATDDLHVHHLTYARKYNEPLYDLVTLCKMCHEIAHIIE